MNRVGEFLAFKRLPLPADARSEAVVSDPGQRVARGAGMQCNLAPLAPWPCADERRGARLWGGINLGDGPTSVALINLPCAALAAELRCRFPDRPAPATVGELATSFLQCCSDYPPIRLTLGPGEGWRLPAGGLILGPSPADAPALDVALLISQPATAEG